ncbi:transmembrane-type terpene cyclase [Paenibacillus sedimenti]|uniref:Integral membrane protein n=1 Tax=Paenibacillus sedimenti TaxID=2770274 RepID=A0A926KVD3_9BACL|nr:hypothetical protein [Paenibacillus sedimenti]MBD0384003.1 hypothetical protein [Paenibacillus sedimenti]
MEHLLPFPIERLLQIGMGFFWTITYILIIFKGLQDRTVGMPFASLCANLTWEAMFSFIFPLEPLQFTINMIWLTLDCIILLQFIIYFRSMFPSIRYKYAFLLGSLATAFLINLGITIEFHDMVGKYSAFGMNFMMSLLFILLALRQGTRGQSVYIGYTKWIGTFCSSILFYSLYPQSLLLFILSALTFILDVIYIIVLKHQSAKRFAFSATNMRRATR